jgi:hypothetical protein
MVESLIKWELSPDGTTHVLIVKGCFYWEKYTDTITRWIWDNGMWVKSNTYYNNNYIRISKKEQLPCQMI